MRCNLLQGPDFQRRLSRFGVNFPVFVAPMVGVSNLPFRKLIRHYTPAPLKALLFTEMLSTRKLATSKLNLVEEVRFDVNDTPLIVQLLGNEEKFIAASLRRLDEAQPWGIDINMGCPVAHTLRYNWGVRLMGDPSYAAQVVAMTRKHTAGRLSVKLRASANDNLNPEYLDELTRAIENAGADWITIHARTKAEKHRGRAHWDAVGEIAIKRNIPVVLNGNLQTDADLLRAWSEFPVDGLMVGRSAMVRPWILWQLAERLGLCSSSAPRGPVAEGREYVSACLKLIQFYREDFTNEAAALKQMQFFIGHATRWFDFGHDFWKRSVNVKSLDELETSIQAHQENVSLRMETRISY